MSDELGRADLVQQCRRALKLDSQLEAFDLLDSQGFDPERVMTLVRNPVVYGDWTNFAPLKAAIITASPQLWDRLMVQYGRAAASA